MFSGVSRTTVLALRGSAAYADGQSHRTARSAVAESDLLKRPPRGKGRLVLVTAINPTPAGEGKTTTSIALAMGMQRLGKKHSIPGQVAMEQIMVCGFGACYVCMRTFEVDGQRVLRRVCRDGPVFNMQEAVGW